MFRYDFYSRPSSPETQRYFLLHGHPKSYTKVIVYYKITKLVLCIYVPSHVIDLTLSHCMLGSWFLFSLFANFLIKASLFYGAWKACLFKIHFQVPYEYSGMKKLQPSCFNLRVVSSVIGSSIFIQITPLIFCFDFRFPIIGQFICCYLHGVSFFAWFMWGCCVRSSLS